MAPYPEWLHILSLALLSFSFLCAAIIIIDELRRPQKMLIMNFVWPISAIYFGPGALWGYFRSGPKMTKEHHQQMQRAVQAERWPKREIRPMTSGQSDPNAPTFEQAALADNAHNLSRPAIRPVHDSREPDQQGSTRVFSKHKCRVRGL